MSRLNEYFEIDKKKPRRYKVCFLGKEGVLLFYAEYIVILWKWKGNVMRR